MVVKSNCILQVPTSQDHCTAIQLCEVDDVLNKIQCNMIVCIEL